MHISRDYLNPIFLNEITRGMPATTGADSHVFFRNDGVVVKGYPELSERQLLEYQGYTREVARLVDGEIELRNGVAWVKTVLVAAVVPSEDDRYRCYTISRRSVIKHLGSTLNRYEYEETLDRVNEITYRRLRLHHIRLVDLNAKNIGRRTVESTDIAADIGMLMREVGIY